MREATDNGAPALGPGDGLVPAASAQGLPIQGGSGVPALLTPNVVRVDLGSTAHSHLMSATVVGRFAAILLDRDNSIAEAPSWEHQGQ
jgi:hypothetical protein